MSYNLANLINELTDASPFAVFHGLEGRSSLGLPVCKKHWYITPFYDSGGRYLDLDTVMTEVRRRGWRPMRDARGLPLEVRARPSGRHWGGNNYLLAEALKAGHALMRVPSRIGASRPAQRYFLVESDT
jgi:hypothetical protein